MDERLMRMAQIILGLYGDLWAIEDTRFIAYLRGASLLLDTSDQEGETKEYRTPYRLFIPNGDATTTSDCIGTLEDFSTMQSLREKASTPGTYVGVLPLEGPITPKSGRFGSYYGGVGLDRWVRDLKEMTAMENVGSIIIDTDSPGGSVAGLLEAAEAVRQAKQQKPISFLSNTWMASAAYWLGSQGSDIYVTPSGEVGSVGVYSLHLDFSGMLEKAGVAATFVHAGEHKVEGNPFQPLSESARAEMQASVDYYYDRFVKEVAEGRKVSQAKVKADFGGGRMLRPEAAVDVGMADGIMRLDDLIVKHATRIKNRQRRSAEKEELEQLSASQPVAPYPNERSCRLRSPGDFQEGSFRRIQRSHKGKTYSVIIGRPKGKSTTEEQAYRYKKNTWTAEEARTHCKEHGGSFEDASGD